MPTLTDPEVLAFVARTEACYPADANLADPAENRRLYDAMCAAFRAPRPAGVRSEDGTVAARDPERLVPVRSYRQDGSGAPATVLYSHGGGYVVGGLDSHDDVCAELCAATGFRVVSVDYRLAPEHLYPAQLDDVAAVHLHLAAAGTRVVAAGDSAGGCLSAALAHRMRRTGAPMPAGLVLVYPGLGGSMTAPSYIENALAPMLRTADVAYYAGVLTGGAARTGRADPELSPLQATEASGLPPTAILSADIDPLRDDGRDYAALLAASGVPAAWRNERQLVHGHLRARHSAWRARESFAAVCRAVEAFGRGEPLPAGWADTPA